jgi:PPOX class probable F420-dependent enzyme
MLNPDVRRVLDGTSLAHLATVLPDGSPHTVPLWVGTHGDHIVFLTGPQSRKARNLRRDPRVALSITPPTTRSSPSSSAAGSSNGSTAIRPGRSSTRSQRSTSAGPTTEMRSASSPSSSPSGRPSA